MVTSTAAATANPKTPWQLVLLLARPLSRSFLILGVLSCAAAGLQAGYIWLIKNFLTAAAENRARSAVLVSASALLAVWILRSTADYFVRVNRERASRGMEFATMDLVLRQLLRMSMSYFDRASRGELLTILRTDIASLRAYSGALMQGGVAALTTLVLAVTAFRLEPRLALLGFVLVPVIMAPVAQIGRRLVQASAGGVRVGIRLNEAVMQILQGIRVIKAYGQEAQELERCRTLRLEYHRAALRLVRFRARGMATLDGAAGLAITAIIIVGGGGLVGPPASAATLFAFLMVMVALVNPLRDLLTAYSDAKVQAPVLHRVLDLLAWQDDVPEPREPLPLPAAGALELRGVTHAFGQRTVLRDIDLVVRSGEVVAVVGPSGSGKTTLLNLMARFYDPTQGVVSLGGVDLRRVARRDLRSHLALVAQEPFLFSASAYDNIAYGEPSASREEIIEAARRASIETEILALPDGYETPIGLSGVILSGGQTQRIALARAFVRRAPLLLLDEPTSALDSQTELHIQESLRTLPGKSATVVVAHRLSTIKHADRIVVLCAGRIEAQGSFSQVMATSPTFRQLWQLQQWQEVTPTLLATAPDQSAGSVEELSEEDAQ